MKKLISSISILALVGLSVAVSVGAADVDVTVTPQVVSVTVTDGTVDYGTLAAGDSNDTFNGPAASTQTITSTGNVSIDVVLRSSDAYVIPNTTDWALEGTAGTDIFEHSYAINAASTPGFAFPFDGTFVNTNTGTVVTLPSNGNSATLDLGISMPTSIGNTAAHSIDVTVVASAT